MSWPCRPNTWEKGLRLQVRVSSMAAVGGWSCRQRRRQRRVSLVSTQLSSSTISTFTPPPLQPELSPGHLTHPSIPDPPPPSLTGDLPCVSPTLDALWSRCCLCWCCRRRCSSSADGRCASALPLPLPLLALSLLISAPAWHSLQTERAQANAM